MFNTIKAIFAVAARIFPIGAPAARARRLFAVAILTGLAVLLTACSGKSDNIAEEVGKSPPPPPGGDNGGAKVGKIRMAAMAMLFAFGQTFALPASAQTKNTVSYILIPGALGCGIGALASLDESSFGAGEGCVAGLVVVGIGAAGYYIADNIFGANSRWSFDGDGMPKAVYSLSDAAKLSFGAKGKPLDYDGVAIGVKYSF